MKELGSRCQLVICQQQGMPSEEFPWTTMYLWQVIKLYKIYMSVFVWSFRNFFILKHDIVTFILGGWEGDNTQVNAIGEVLQWDIYSQKWMLKSYIMPRLFHSVSVLPCDEVKNYCISKKKSFPKKESVDIQNIKMLIGHGFI